MCRVTVSIYEDTKEKTPIYFKNEGAIRECVINLNIDILFILKCIKSVT